MADFMESAINFPRYSTKGPPKNPGEIIRRVQDILAINNHIFDRFSLISEMVYGPILRENHVFDPLWLNRLTEDKYIVVYCRPPREIIQATLLATKPHKTAELRDEVTRKRDRIIDAYDKIMGHITHKIKYDYTQKSARYLCAELIFLLDRMKSEE